MDTTFYNGMVQTATNLLQKFGQTVIITRTSGSITNVHNSNGVVLDTKPYTLNDVGSIGHRISNDKIDVGDDVLYLDNSFEPKPGDRIQYNDQDRVIADPVIVLNPASIKLVYQILARHG